jgi:ATP-dependent Lon protease
MDSSAHNGSPSTGQPATQVATPATDTQATPPVASEPEKDTTTVLPPAAKAPEKSNDQVEQLRAKVAAATMPDDLKQSLIDRIERLDMIRISSGFMSPSYITEYEATAGYVTWTTALPWEKTSQDTLDLVKAKQILDEHHYGIENMKSAILEYLSSIILNARRTDGKSSHAPVICFIGLAGTGKTTIASAIADALGRKFERIPFGGMSDSRTIRGQSRLFPDAEPGAIIKALVRAGTKNPVILLDEMDRVSESARGDIMGVLLELLDPGQNKAFVDHYIDYPFNLSNVLFIATGNNTTNVSTAVLDRLQILQMPSYSDDEKTHIAQSYLFKRIRDECGLMENELIIDDSVWPLVIRPLGFDSGIRSLDRTVSGMCRKAARMIVEGKATQIVITADNVKQFLPSY